MFVRPGLRLTLNTQNCFFISLVAERVAYFSLALKTMKYKISNADFHRVLKDKKKNSIGIESETKNNGLLNNGRSQWQFYASL